MLTLLEQGDAILQMMQVTGEEGVTLDDFVTYQKALFLDMVYLQQDAFDPVDSSVPLKRQAFIFNKIVTIVNEEISFGDKEQARDYFTRLTGLFKNFNYAGPDSPEYDELLGQIDGLAGSMGFTG